MRLKQILLYFIAVIGMAVFSSATMAKALYKVTFGTK